MAKGTAGVAWAGCWLAHPFELSVLRETPTAGSDELQLQLGVSVVSALGPTVLWVQMRRYLADHIIFNTVIPYHHLD